MTTLPSEQGTPDVPAQVFEKFLQTLGETGVSAEIIRRLRKALLEERTLTERTLTAAVLGEELLP